MIGEAMSIPTKKTMTKGKFVGIASNYLLTTVYGKYAGDIESSSVKLDCLHPENTYIAIFNHNQDIMGEALEKDDRIKVLFKGRRAVNLNPNHGREPRNTIFVFELSDKGKEEVKKDMAELAEKSKNWKKIGDLWNLYYGHPPYSKSSREERQTAYAQIRAGEYIE